MSDTKLINIDEYNYALPDDRIAKYPIQSRDASKLLVYQNKEISHTVFSNLPELIPPGTLLVRNNSKVVNARIMMEKETGASIEIMCLEPADPDNYEQSFKQKQQCEWNCLVGNLSKWKKGTISKTIFIEGRETTLTAELKETEGDIHRIEFTWNNDQYNFGRILEIFGVIPIPPYLNRNTELIDQERYQSVFSSVYGSVAAPTGGLHFTDELISQLNKNHVYCLELTLHVGAATFKPVKTQIIGDHEMHSEYVSIPATLPAALLACPDHVIAVGTTTLRTLESIYYIGVLLSQNPDAEPEDLIVGQWMPYYPENNRLSVEHSIRNVDEYMKKRKIKQLSTTTRILIAPGYDFKIVTGLITNFHQPCSTLLLLVSAFVESDWRRIYDYAINNNFRFLSYGDASLLLSRRFKVPKELPPEQFY